MDLEIESNMLNLEIAGISLKNPAILASGFLGISQAIFERILMRVPERLLANLLVDILWRDIGILRS